MVNGHIVTRAALQNPQYHRLRPTLKRRVRCRLCTVMHNLAVLMPLFH